MKAPSWGSRRGQVGFINDEARLRSQYPEGGYYMRNVLCKAQMFID